MQWEYNYVESGNHKLLMDDLNKLGAEGWEVIDIERIHGVTIAYLKRPKE